MQLPLLSQQSKPDVLVEIVELLEEHSYVQLLLHQLEVVMHGFLIGAYLLAEEGTSLSLLVLLANLEIFLHRVVAFFNRISDDSDNHLWLELTRQLQMQSEDLLPDLCLLGVGCLL